jgi:hypothetical protein
MEVVERGGLVVAMWVPLLQVVRPQVHHVMHQQTEVAAEQIAAAPQQQADLVDQGSSLFATHLITLQ